MRKGMELKNNETSLRVLEAARIAWDRGGELRSRRVRYKRFTYGDQWSDIVTDADGNRMTEGDDARRKGRRPMTNNLIRRLVKCIVGRFRMKMNDDGSRKGIAEGVADGVAERIRALNRLDELDSRMLEEFLISGCAIQRIVSERRRQGKGVWVDNVSPGRFFVNATSDPRGWDIELVGMLHDMSPAETVMRFAKGDMKRAAAIRRLFGGMSSRPFSLTSESQGFFGEGNGRCRVIEAWTLEAVERLRCHDPENGSLMMRQVAEMMAMERENARRRAEGRREMVLKLEVTTVWHCRWLAPDGTVLDEYDSPYCHGGHPFAVKFYPLTDGEIHSLVEDVIDQQLYVNRLITLIDHIMSTSAKGALMFPVGQKIPEMSWTELARIWSSPDAVIPYQGIGGYAEPKQISTNATDIGARELLTLEMQMFEEVSGVSNALMGKSSGGGNVGADRYAQEVENALVTIADILESFNDFRRTRDAMIIGTESGRVVK